MVDRFKLLNKAATQTATKKKTQISKKTTKQNNDTNKQFLFHSDERLPGNSTRGDALMYIHSAAAQLVLKKSHLTKY